MCFTVSVYFYLLVARRLFENLVLLLPSGVWIGRDMGTKAIGFREDEVDIAELFESTGKLLHFEFDC